MYVKLNPVFNAFLRPVDLDLALRAPFLIDFVHNVIGRILGSFKAVTLENWLLG